MSCKVRMWGQTTHNRQTTLTINHIYHMRILDINGQMDTDGMRIKLQAIVPRNDITGIGA